MPSPPSDAAPIADRDGRVTQAWRAFFAALSGSAGPSRTILADAGPYTFSAPASGSLVIQGGTISGLTLVRGRQPIALSPALTVVPVSAGDGVMITYTDTPGLVFVPA